MLFPHQNAKAKQRRLKKKRHKYKESIGCECQQNVLQYLTPCSRGTVRSRHIHIHLGKWHLVKNIDHKNTFMNSLSSSSAKKSVMIFCYCSLILQISFHVITCNVIQWVEFLNRFYSSLILKMRFWKYVLSTGIQKCVNTSWTQIMINYYLQQIISL